ncbi:MAG: aldehyde dehydrogenase family protein, partial [Clostridia bacterium]|nr:aldehyde dehydrogenase family protein [Clostridia bacterium]
MELDKDLASIQEARDLVKKAKAAQAVLAEMDQQQVDRIVAAMAGAAERNAQKLAQMAVADTGFGKESDKVVKNLFAARTVYNYIKDEKTIGIIHEDTQKKMLEVAIPVGVVAGLVPSTNPTSTTIFKALICVKAGNALIISPHPGAMNCIGETV